jgi:RNA polymerase sigma-70 factor (sigma-E family)
MREPDEQFTGFVAARGAALLRTAYLLTGDQQLSEDLVQTALEKALRSWSRISASEAVESYVRAIMYRENVSIWRRRRGREIPVAEVPEQRAATSMAESDDRLVVRQALLRLAPRQRTVLVLRFYEDLTEEQVARAMGVSVGTVKSQTAKAFSRLRQSAPELRTRRYSQEAT